MRELTPENIITLKENEVFVFGSNATGFHGAGAAGMAFRGTAVNTWRSDDMFQKAMQAPVGSPLRVGRWAIYGQAHGFQKGTEGKSYAIETIRRPGILRSTPLSEILAQIQDLNTFAKDHPELKFLVTKIGSKLAGYTTEEIAELFKQVPNLQDNIILPREYEFRA